MLKKKVLQLKSFNLSFPTRMMASEGEIKSMAGIANIEHLKLSKKQFQKLKDKNFVSVDSIVDTT